MTLITKPDLVDITRTMQHMDAHNGGLLVDFRPIRRYEEIAPGPYHYERVRTVLDWIAFAARLGLLAPWNWPRMFESREDPARFAAELRRYDLPLDSRHAHAFEVLGIVRRGHVSDYATIADAIDGMRPQRATA